MAITKNDELNIASYEQYFGEMELSEKEKKDRIQLAHKMKMQTAVTSTLMINIAR